MLRKLPVIFLLAVHLVGNTELGQLLKLPRLVTHFYQHQQLDPSVNFIEFVVMHYAGDDGTRADDAADQQLPCHNLRNNSFAVAYAPMVRDIPSISGCVQPKMEYNNLILAGPGTGHVFLHLQPPRLV